jgi:hypothetical protein
MTTLRDRVDQRDRARFVGRARQIAWFERIFRGELAHNVIHLTGIGGIGKSALLREIARRAGDHGFRVVWIEGRDLPPFPEEIDAALGDLGDDPALVVLDSYELISSLDSHLREIVIPNLPASTVVVIGSRTKPSRGWFEGGWDGVVHHLELDGLPRGELRDLARRHGVEDPQLAAQLALTSHGSPLAVVMGASTGSVGSMAELADRLMGNEAEKDRYGVLSVAAIARVTTPELLDAVLGARDVYDDFKWLADRSFCEPLAEGVAMHSLVAQAVRDSLRQRDPMGEAALRRRIADDLYRRAIAGQHSLSTDLQHLVVDQTVRWGFSLDIGSRYHIDSIRPGDLDKIGEILTAVDHGDWWAVTRALIEANLQIAGVARDRDGSVGGYYVAVSPANAPPEADDDLLLGPWLRHARTVLRTTSAVLWREAVDLTLSMGEVTSLLGAGGIIGSGVDNPRYGYLPIAPALPAAKAFSEALGATHIPELDVITMGQHLECHMIDFGPRGVLGFQRDWIYRETGAPPPRPDTEEDPGRLIRLLRDPAALTHGPDWLGDRPSTRLATLREMVTDALTVFGDSRDDQLAREIVSAAYLEDSAPHEALARRFHLSRSAYFRRLQAATARVGDEIASRSR